LAEASLGGRLGTAFLLMQCVFSFACGLQLGGGSCKPQRPHANNFLHAKNYLSIRRVRPLSRLLLSKKLLWTARRKVSPE